MNLAAGEERAKTKTKSENDDRCFRRLYRHHPLLEYARGRKKRLGDAHFHHRHSLEKKLEEFLHPYETLGIDGNAITAKYAGEMFLNYCLSSTTSSSSLCCCCCCCCCCCSQTNLLSWEVELRGWLLWRRFLLLGVSCRREVHV